MVAVQYLALRFQGYINRVEVRVVRVPENWGRDTLGLQGNAGSAWCGVNGAFVGGDNTSLPVPQTDVSRAGAFRAIVIQEQFGFQDNGFVLQVIAD